MATTFHFELNSTANKAGKYAIMLRITQNRKHKRLKTSIELNRKSDWNPKKEEVRTSEPNYEKWNDALAKEKEAARANVQQAESAVFMIDYDRLAAAMTKVHLTPVVALDGEKVSRSLSPYTDQNMSQRTRMAARGME